MLFFVQFTSHRHPFRLPLKHVTPSRHLFPFRRPRRRLLALLPNRRMPLPLLLSIFPYAISAFFFPFCESPLLVARLPYGIQSPHIDLLSGSITVPRAVYFSNAPALPPPPFFGPTIADPPNLLLSPIKPSLASQTFLLLCLPWGLLSSLSFFPPSLSDTRGPLFQCSFGSRPLLPHWYRFLGPRYISLFYGFLCFLPPSYNIVSFKVAGEDPIHPEQVRVRGIYVFSLPEDVTSLLE